MRTLDSVIRAQLNSELVPVLLPIKLPHPAVDAEARVVEHAIHKAVSARDGIVNRQASCVAQRISVGRELRALQQNGTYACKTPQSWLLFQWKSVATSRYGGGMNWSCSSAQGLSGCATDIETAFSHAATQVQPMQMNSLDCPGLC